MNFVVDSNLGQKIIRSFSVSRKLTDLNGFNTQVMHDSA